MAAKKPSKANRMTKKDKLISQNISSNTTPDYINSSTNSETSSIPKRKISKVLYLVPLIVAILALLLWKNKGLIVAATLNNTPIWRWDVEKVLVSRYGTTTLDEIINEQLIKNEAQAKGVKVTPSDVEAKISQLSKTLPAGMTLKDALSQQGMTEEDLKKQVELQLIVEKLTANISVTDKEIADYISANKDSLPATDEASLKIQAREVLTRQNRSTEFKKIFDNLKKSTKVTKYL